MVHRLINVPMSTNNFQKELNIIVTIAKQNGYKQSIIENIIRKKQKTQIIKSIYPIIKEPLSGKFASILYIGKGSNCLEKMLKKLDIIASFRTDNSLGKLIKNNKDPNIKTQHSGVYLLNCKDCPKVYVGQTGRSFEERIKEHRTAFINNKSTSTYANHLIEDTHEFDEDFKILHTESKGRKLNLLENVEINKRKYSGNLLNDQLDLSTSPLLNIFTSRTTPSTLNIV